MQNVYLAATAATPEVDFRFDTHSLSLKGESYPENAQAFYGPLLEMTARYLAGLDHARIVVDVQLAYFNSSSTKLLMSLFELFNDAAVKGNYVTLNWHYDEDDDTILEFGEEIADDYPALDFVAHALVA
ncbi:uncharacterized protein DUF1987 [Crenobacter luteus]|uniref:Fe-S oxidoreductase n=1 Tax=Crenobacter luteus TaxID=1452487 RepID=A0A161RB42_9NEIS|nr:DUF1987 domain-containing protein [Crenobacter luteus]KZE34298.1 Fe-S oxidoreductase [Crenobacter luteus]TCP15169.1 uncharacterized protein DUF1987 [Crenobacter luteus]